MSVVNRPVVATEAERTAPLQLRQRFARVDVMSVVALLLLALIAWAWTLYLATTMDMMDDMPTMQRAADPNTQWDAARVMSTFAMWTIMMAAMMLPSVTSVVLLHRRVAAHYRAREDVTAMPATALLVLGYLLIWTGFSALATLAQIGLSIAAQITPMLTLLDRRFAAVVLLCAGIYQFTPIKQRCLIVCRSPLVFLTQHYRAGKFGALRMGIVHGAFCLGCCWAAMALLFVGGVMNPIWIAGLSAFVLIEKLFPFGRIIGAALGGIAVIVGLYQLL